MASKAREWNRQKPYLGYGIRTDGKESWIVDYLLAVFLFNEGAGTVAADLKNGNSQTLTTPVWSASGVNCASSTGVNTVNTGSESLVIWYTPLSLPNGGTVVRNSTAANGQTGLDVEQNLSDGRYYFSVAQPTTVRAAYRYSSATGDVAGTTYFRVAVYDATGQTLHWYDNGNNIWDGSQAGTAPTSQVQTATLLTASGSTINYITIIRVSKALSGTEIADLYNRPYCMIQPRRVRVRSQDLEDSA